MCKTLNSGRNSWEELRGFRCERVRRRPPQPPARCPPPRLGSRTLGAAVEARDGCGLAMGRWGFAAGEAAGARPAFPLALLHWQRAISREPSDLQRTERSQQTGAGLGAGGSPPPHTAARMLRSLKRRLSHGQFQFWGAGWG